MSPSRPVHEGDLVMLVGGLSSVRMDDYAVAGSYMRYDEQVRERLKDARLRIAEACAQPARRRDNHLVWAAPGSGKTYFVEQAVGSLDGVGYLELNLAKLDEDDLRSGLERATVGGPLVCLVDEVDAKPEASWPYEVLMPFLDVNLERGGGLVFVLAGSSGGTMGEFKERIAARPKGADLLSRVPEANEWEIPPMAAGDRILVALSQMLNAAGEVGRPVAAVEKLALYYLASALHLGNARQLREFAVRAVGRGSPSGDRVRYDDLFDSGDPESKRFWASVMPEAGELENAFVRVEGRPAGPVPHRPQEPVSLSLPAKPSIAVLPFVNMSGDPEQEFFADGVAEDVITGLSRLRWLFVIARNSSFTFKGRSVDVREVGRELGVRYILEGSVRIAGDRMRVTAQLVEAETGNHIWAERYDRAREDVFAVQDEITGSVIGCIQPEVYAAEHERAKRKPPQSLDTWEAFLRAVFLYSQRSQASTGEALDLLERAIALDPTYAQAHGLRAVCLAWRAFQGWEDRQATFAEAAESARLSVTHDADEPWAAVGRGFVAVARHRDAESVQAFGLAVELSPNFAYAHGLLGAAHALGGRPEQAIPSIDRAVRLSPRDIFFDEFQLYYAFAHFQAARYAEAALAAEQSFRRRPGHPVPCIIAAASYGLSGDIVKATELLTEVRGLEPGISAREIEESFVYCLEDDRRRVAAGLRVGGLE
jgi:TolB-like protein/cytochrome c-type biogenesis protein CcmH/NrfG